MSHMHNCQHFTGKKSKNKGTKRKKQVRIKKNHVNKYQKTTNNTVLKDMNGNRYVIKDGRVRVADSKIVGICIQDTRK